jgi:AraC family transcriptional regulator
MLFRSALVDVERITHVRDRRGNDPGEDRADCYSMNFVERGTFALQMRKRRWTIGVHEIFVTAPDMDYRCREIDRRRGDAPGACLDVRFSDSARDAIEERAVAGLREHLPVVPVNNRRAYLQRRLARYLTNAGNPLAVDLIAGELLHSTFADDGAPRRRYTTKQLEWYGRRIDESRRMLHEDYSACHTLDRLARNAGMSAYHFARIFRELAGVPPHRYLIRRRLEAAAERLRDGASVTGVCYEVGFGNLSHFIHMFRACYGIAPSRWRSAGPAREANG